MDTRIITDMFHLGQPWMEKVLRPVVVYCFLVIGLRLSGKRELAQLNPLDLIVLLTLSNTVQNAIIGDDNSVTGGLIGATTLLTLNYVVVRFLYRHSSIERLVEGSPVTLVENGELRPSNCAREFITVEELESAARRQGLESLDAVKAAVLEPGGTITFIPKTPTEETRRHNRLIHRLDDIARDLDVLKGIRRDESAR
jgi:uncharacterized membrane protein YcaP (DUF421 family)